MSQIPLFFGKKFAKTEIYILRELKNHHNCPQYESRVLKIFTLHILNIVKFGWIYLCVMIKTWATMSQNYKIKIKKSLHQMCMVETIYINWF
jgi:hypothetical protein